MSQLSLMITIIARSLTKKFLYFYQKQGLEISYITVGSGTAVSEVLDYFGLDGSEKALLFSVVTDKKWHEVKHGLQRKMNIDLPGIGIAFLVPLSSIGGKKALNYLTCGQEFIKGEESQLKDTNYELLIAITNLGYTELVMNAAHKVYATGGTIIHARGTGTEKAEKFLGVSLTAEKEIVFIVVKSKQKDLVMRSIMDKAGLDTKAKSIVFSLPVTGTAGMRLLEELEDE